MLAGIHSASRYVLAECSVTPVVVGTLHACRELCFPTYWKDSKIPHHSGSWRKLPVSCISAAASRGGSWPKFPFTSRLCFQTCIGRVSETNHRRGIGGTGHSSQISEPAIGKFHVLKFELHKSFDMGYKY